MSGGNVYDRRIRDGLPAHGWTVQVLEVADAGEAASALRGAPDDALVLVDGLVAGWVPAALEDEASRLRLVLLAHMVVAAFPDATDAEADAERRALATAGAVIVTSRWTAGELARRGLTDPSRITVAIPGVQHVDAGVPASDKDLLCVGVLAPHKGQDTLLDALGRLRTRDWTCAIVGSPEPFPRFAAVIAERAAAFDGRVQLTGVLDEDGLAEAYGRSALLVAPSRVESWGMAIADARARGIPVVGSAAGGIPDALAGGGGLLVCPDDPAALADVLEAWMSDPGLRARLRREAVSARASLPTWADTVAHVVRALEAA
ncbi:glycosyltransferase family 4 protein [Microbacterium sp. QXD-8]|uniref:Glycosyltransferase family 4 protein n=1 Tax=Microbacterium psychrotolerans TaxID=3068321 RepID=A0ABU0Z716_9MICO|nr:glycosyltransferase family 4 protein [Microbacterium sp. QXD-8]MDQ7879569.1 glycosyltransferase family 4 protein [Microbacterium sp. QXD-8]